MSNTKLTRGIHLYLDGNRGQYIPKSFATTTKRDCIQGVKAEDLDYLARGPGGCLDSEDDAALVEGETERGEWYWETWDRVLDNAVLVDPDTGNRFKLFIGEGGGDLFLVSEDWEWNDDLNTYEEPESDTLKRFDLPVDWASSLINGDDSGISEQDSADIKKFLDREELNTWTCADVSERSHFAKYHDAGTGLGSTVSRYTFVKIG